MNNYIEYFTNYVYKNYDMNNYLISLKYYHSLRVAKLMMILATKLNMSEEDKLLAFKLGLCHDLGRFYEVVLNGKFNNLKFDHGSYSNKILYNDKFVNYMDIDDDLLFRKAIYNHNKKDITNDLNMREEIFTKMLRDIDKLDILNLMVTHRKFNFIEKPSDIVLEHYYNGTSIDLKDIKNQADSVVFYLNFFKELYFDINKDMAINYGYLKNYLDVVLVSEENKELFNNIVNEVDKERGKVYVR